MSISNGSLWSREVDKPDFPGLDQDKSVDAAIVGGGITGLGAAALLREAGLSVAVVEARTLGAGTTGGTSAHVTAIPDGSLREIISKFGLEGAQRTLATTQAALAQIEKNIKNYGIECEFLRIPAYRYGETEKQVASVKEEFEAAMQIKIVAEMLENAPLPFATRAAIRFAGQARFHPLKYIYALASALQDRGCFIYENTRMIDVKDGETCEVLTARGTVRAKHVFLATHTPAGLLPLVQTRIAPYRSYVIAARVAEAEPDALYWDSTDPYHYIRRNSDADSNLLVIGGEDHKTGQMENPEQRYSALEEYARARFDVQKVERRWSAQYFEPVDLLPYIGLAPMAKHVYIATGFSGVGLAFGTAAGMLVRDHILGRENEALALFSPSRVNPLASAQEFIVQNLNVAAQYVKGYFGEELTHGTAHLKNCEGDLIEIEGKKIAVFKDEQGSPHALSPVCPHLKGIVQWNNTEKSWDCPCHGSRFGPKGEMLEGPATSDLTSLSLHREDQLNEKPKAAAKKPRSPKKPAHATRSK